jgi:hypothetical protein
MILTEEEKKERKKEYNTLYREKNKEKLREKDRLYYEKNKEKRKEEYKEYRQKNKEKNKECIRLWREQNKEYLKEKGRLYREKNKEKNKEYHKTENGKKSYIINGWKRINVKNDDFDKLYDYYLNCKNCEECNVKLTSGRCGANHKCLDHDHKTGEFRNVLCHTCNLKRGIIDRGHIPLTGAEIAWKCRLKAFILS